MNVDTDTLYEYENIYIESNNEPVKWKKIIFRKGNFAKWQSVREKTMEWEG